MRVRDWLYTLGIFVTITVILMFPLYISVPLVAVMMLPWFILIGFVVALFSAYVLTPLSLRGVKPFKDAPPGVLNSLNELSGRAGIKPPKLMIVETPELNAMTYVSIFGSRVCVTRGLMNCYLEGKIGEEELKAVLGHEIGHIKNFDCLRWSFVLSWISIFDVIGTLYIIGGGIVTGISSTLWKIEREERKEISWTTLILALLGLTLILAGFIAKLIAKIASLPAFHHSRIQEYAADMEASRLTSPQATINALQKIHTLNNELIAEQLAQLPYADRWQLQPRNSTWIDRLFDTHPPLERRIDKLRAISSSS